jgi:hypothetical protein
MIRTAGIGLAAALLLGLYTADTARAQQRTARRERTPEESMTVGKLIGVGRRGLVKTPEYRSNVNRGAGQPREWAQIAVQYETFAEWLDDVTFQYWVLAMRKEDGQNVYSLYKKSVRYSDIAAGRDHLSTVFLRPEALERFGPVVAAAVEVTIGGTLVGEASEAEIEVPGKWWRNPQVVESPQVTAREGYLLNRVESPWALINMDDYEVIR